MSAKVLNHSYHLGKDYIKVLTLPDDLMHTPYQVNSDLEIAFTRGKASICHSDTTGKWYILVELPELIPEYPEVYDYLYDSGTWVEIAYCLCLGYIYAPFKWGKPIASKHSKNIQYLPIWETIHTGRYNYNDDYSEITEEHYKLIRIGNHCCFPDPNTMQHNDYTSFEIFEYTDLIQMVKDIECFTGIKF